MPTMRKSRRSRARVDRQVAGSRIEVSADQP
jgi:hypothetical protein